MTTTRYSANAIALDADTLDVETSASLSNGDRFNFANYIVVRIDRRWVIEKTGESFTNKRDAIRACRDHFANYIESL